MKAIMVYPKKQLKLVSDMSALNIVGLRFLLF